MAQRRDYIYDELLCFLGNPFFQVPVITFMEEQCLIFDPEEENAEEYKKIHGAYKDLVTQLLEAFKKDTGLKEEDIIRALTDMNAKADLKEVFQAIFEQVLAMDDYSIFKRIMIKKNIELQEQALAMLMQKQGVLPHSLREAKDDPPPPSQENLYGPQSEDEILQAVLAESKREYEEEQARQKASKQVVQEQQSMADFAKVEQAYLENTKKSETEKLDQELRKLSMESVSTGSKAVEMAKPQTKPVSQTDLKSAPSLVVVPPPPAPVLPAPVQAPAPAPAPTPAPTSAPAQASVTAAIAAQNLPSINKNQPKISSAEAAANWMKQANDETMKSDAHSAAVNARAAEMAKLNPEELKKRQQFLKEQRDKLLEMKKKEREKTLLNAEKNQPKRPSSARVAKAALGKGDGDGGAKLSPEEEKKLAMRKAIADRLKAEMLGNK